MAPTRRQRKAIASGTDIPLAQPDRSGPKTKTLFELAEEREAELKAQADSINASRARQRQQQQDSSESAVDLADEEPFLNALLYAVSLTALHFTLDVLVFHQYGQDILWSFIVRRLVPAFFAFLVIIYLFHTPTANKLPVLRQLFFATASTVIGCYMVLVSNKHPYLAVMVRAPPLGAAWVWCVVEMRWDLAAASLAIVAAWSFWKDLGFW